MEALFRLLPGPQPLWVRIAATALIVGAAFAFRLSVGEGTGRFGFIHFILPVIAAALLFERTAGFFAVALSVLAVGSIIPWESRVETNVSAIFVFVMVASCLVFVADGLRSALSKAHAAQRATDLLLQEMSHRVKNKFAMISSIIALQSRSSSPEVKHALEDVSRRVQIIATVHDFLQLSRHNGRINMSEYVPGLCRALQQALCGPRPISLTARAEFIELPAEKALATGLIINELVTNAFKYAFPDDDAAGHIEVEVTSAEQDVILNVNDDGVGRPVESKGGLGTRLVTVFAGQLGGAAHWTRDGSPGCKVSIRFPK